jgi:hypothetical protein
MYGKTSQAHVDWTVTVRRLLEAEVVSLQEFAAELDPERRDALLNPWRGSDRAAIQRALGH